MGTSGNIVDRRKGPAFRQDKVPSDTGIGQVWYNPGANSLVPANGNAYGWESDITIGVNPTMIIAGASVGSTPVVPPFTVWNAGAGTLTYTITWTPDPWVVTVVPPGGVSTGPANPHTLVLNTAALPPGVYNSTITVTDPNAINNPVDIPVQITIVPAPVAVGGYFSGHQSANPSPIDKVDFTTHAVAQLAQMIGRLNEWPSCGGASDTYGYWVGNSTTTTNGIKFQFSTEMPISLGVWTLTGDWGQAEVQTDSYMYICGSESGPHNGNPWVDRATFATDAISLQHCNMSASRWGMTGMWSRTIGFVGSGEHPDQSYHTSIQRLQFSTETWLADSATATAARRLPGSTQGPLHGYQFAGMTGVSAYQNDIRKFVFSTEAMALLGATTSGSGYHQEGCNSQTTAYTGTSGQSAGTTNQNRIDLATDAVTAMVATFTGTHVGSVGIAPLLEDPEIGRTPPALTPSCDEGLDAPAGSFNVWNNGGSALIYSITDNVGWLACVPNSGDSVGETDPITVNYTTSGLPAGGYPALITITDPFATNDPQTVSVWLTVNPVAPVVWGHGYVFHKTSNPVSPGAETGNIIDFVTDVVGLTWFHPLGTVVDVQEGSGAYWTYLNIGAMLHECGPGGFYTNWLRYHDYTTLAAYLSAFALVMSSRVRTNGAEDYLGSRGFVWGGQVGTIRYEIDQVAMPSQATSAVAAFWVPAQPKELRTSGVSSAVYTYDRGGYAGVMPGAPNPYCEKMDFATLTPIALPPAWNIGVRSAWTNATECFRMGGAAAFMTPNFDYDRFPYSTETDILIAYTGAAHLHGGMNAPLHGYVGSCNAGNTTLLKSDYATYSVWVASTALDIDDRGNCVEDVYWHAP